MEIIDFSHLVADPDSTPAAPQRLNSSKKLIPTGLPSMDRLLHGGILSGKLYVLCAYTGYGKSSFAIHLGCVAAAFGFGVAVFHNEMSFRSDYLPRILAWMTGKPFRDYQRGRIPIPPELLQEINSRFHFTDLAADHSSWDHVFQAKIEELTQLHPHGLLVLVDSMDSLPRRSPGANERQALEDAAKTLSDLALNLDVPIWATTQANDEALNADTLNSQSLRDSRGKAMPASLVLGMGVSERSEEKEIATITTIKSRDIPPFQIRVATELACQRFMDLSDGLIPPQVTVTA